MSSKQENYSVNESVNNNNNVMGEQQFSMVPIILAAPVSNPSEMQNDFDIEDPDQTEAKILRERIIRQNTTWVAAYLCGQFLLSVLIMINGGFIYFLMNGFFSIIGVRGLSTRSPLCLIIHFVYSLLNLFASVALTTIAIFMADPVPIVFAIFAVFVFIMTICLRKERILIQNIYAQRKEESSARHIQLNQVNNEFEQSPSIQVSPALQIPIFAPFPGVESKHEGVTQQNQQQFNGNIPQQSFMYYPQQNAQGYSMGQPFVLQVPIQQQ